MQTLQAYKGSVQGLSFSSDGVYLASVGPSNWMVYLWHLATGRRHNRTEGGRVFPAEGGRPPRREAINEMAFAPRGPALAAVFTARFNKTRLGLWPDGLRSNDIVAPGEDVREMAFSPDGTVLAYTTRLAENSYALGRLRTDTGAEVGGRLPLALRTTARRCLGWSPTENLLAVAGWKTSQECEVHCIPLEGPPPPGQPYALPGMPHVLAFSADGRTLAVATYSTINRWDVATGMPLPALTGHGNIMTGLVGLADGRWLSANQDGTVRTWDNGSGKCLDIKEWGLGRLFALAVARDGMRAAVGGEKGAILIWDLD
jgi:WD40 repeat protein